MSNIEKIQKMVKGVYKRPIQIGYESKTDLQRKEGEEWEDHNGRKWKIENGKRKQITKVPPRGFDKCNDCEKLILKDIDQNTYNRMQRCYHCQLEFEADLHRKGEWQNWVKEQEEKRWETVLKEYESEMELNKDTNPFDKSVANALSDENIKNYNE
jgi:hypothetical protein|tara:strand:+ start:396 stop:863 length:468 start_codon:yes stop_codon:yes gene_type:complete